MKLSKLESEVLLMVSNGVSYPLDIIEIINHRRYWWQKVGFGRFYAVMGKLKIEMMIYPEFTDSKGRRYYSLTFIGKQFLKTHLEKCFSKQSRK